MAAQPLWPFLLCNLPVLCKYGADAECRKSLMLPRPRTPNVEGSQSTLDSRAGRPRRSRRQRRLRRQRATPGQRNQNKTGSKVKPYLQSASSPMFYLFEATK